MKKFNFLYFVKPKIKLVVKKTVFLTLFLTLSTFLCAQSITSGLIGSNYWMPNFNYGGKIDQVWPQVEDMNIEIIRIGGHGPNDGYWGAANYDHALDQIASAGAEVMLQISSLYSYAQSEELLIHLANSNRDIKYFAVGNEPDNKFGWDSFDVGDYANTFISRANLIRKYYPNAKISGGSFADYWPGGGGAFERNFVPFFNAVKNAKDNNGKYLLNIFDYHNYNSAYSAANTPAWDDSEFIADWSYLVKPFMDEVNAYRPADEKLSWSISEFNMTYNNSLLNVGGVNFDPPATHKTWSFFAGQHFAMVYGFGMEYGAQGIYSWSLHESSGSRSDGDLSLFDGNDPFSPRSTYYHTQMLTQNRKDNWIASTSTQGRVEVVSMTDNSGTTVMVMNTGETGYNLTVKLDMGTSSANTCVVKVDAGVNKETTDYIAATSTQTYAFDGAGNLVKKIVYTKANADAKTAPTVEDVNPPVTDPIAVPGIVEAEDYSTMYGIQTEACSEGGENVAYIDDNDYMDYLVDVANAGNYEVTFRVAGWAATGRVALRDAQGNTLSAANVPNTGDYQVWADAAGEQQFALQEGEQTLRIFAEGSPFNINNINIVEVADPVKVLTTIVLDPATISINQNEQIDFNAQGFDQFGDPIAINESWSVIGNGTVDVNGLFTGSDAGTQTVKATDGSVSAEATVIVNPIALSATIPGIIQAEDWADQFGLQLEATTDVGGGQNFGYTTVGDYAEYNVEVETAGTYEVSFRVASLNGAAGLNIEINSNVISILDIASTGGWQNWVTLTDQVDLPAGSSVLKLNVIAAGFNCNWMEFNTTAEKVLSSIEVSPDGQIVNVNESIGFEAVGFDQFGDPIAMNETWSVTGSATINANGLFSAASAGTYTITATSGAISDNAIITVNEIPTGAAIPGVIQAEDYSDMFGLTATATTVGYVDAGDWLEYNVDISKTATYTIDLMVASAIATGACEISLDGGPSLGTFNALNTGDWGIYEVSSMNVNLTEGNHVLRLYFTAAAFNIDYMEFTEFIDNPTVNSVAFYPPAIVESGDTYSIDVNYSSTATNEVQVAFFAAGWTWIVGNTQQVDAGSGTITIDLAIPAGTAVGADYIWQTEIHPVGGTWEDRFDVADLQNVQVTNLKSATVGAQNTLNENAVVLYPMPVSNELHVSGLELYSKLNIFNLSGKLVKTLSLNGAETKTIDMSSFERGIYFVEISNQKNSFVNKIVKK
ncbi:MAG: carbohydrate-binding protein [Salinivirgaceae bacterium]|jgi:hypothetical protein|nr:carbohydrate-binding protein [Salinivirgaceae bacterium]